MTTLSRSSRPADLGTLPERAPASTITVRWAISRAALHRARPDLIAPIGPPAVQLAWHLATDDRGLTSGSASLADGGRHTPLLSLLPGAGHLMLDGEFSHIDIRGLLRISSRAGELLYAQTELLQSLPVPGGCYELVPRADE